MLYTIKQLKRGVDSLVVSGFAKNPSQVDRDLKNLDNKGVGNYIKQNAETVKNYFNSLNSDENKQFLHIREVFGSNGNTRVGVVKIFESLGLDKSELYRGKSLEGIIKRIDDFIAERAGVIEGARVEQQELSLSWAKDKLQSYSKNRKRGDINRGNATSWGDDIIAVKVILKDLGYISNSTPSYDNTLASALANFIKDYNSDNTSVGDIKGDVSGSIINKEIVDRLLKSMDGKTRTRVLKAKNERENPSKPQDSASSARVTSSGNSGQPRDKSNRNSPSVQPQLPEITERDRENDILKNLGTWIDSNPGKKVPKEKATEVQRILNSRGHRLVVDGKFWQISKSALSAELGKISQPTSPVGIETGNKSLESINVNEVKAELERVLKEYKSRSIRSSRGITSGRKDRPQADIDIITVVQKALKLLGYDLEVTGTFYGGGLASSADEKTKEDNTKFKKALKKFQQNYDGIDEETLKRLLEDINNGKNCDSIAHIRSSLESLSTPDLVAQLVRFEGAFNYTTRSNKGAKAFMNPEEKDLNVRWDGLKTLADSTEALRNVKLGGFLNTIKSDNDKRIVISTLSQYMKKARSFDNGDISSWNTRTEEFIKTDRDRRRAFNTMFGFDATAEAAAYYDRLIAGKGKIGKTNIMGIGFDASSSIGVEGTGKARGIDVLYTNLSILTVNGKPLLIPITDKSKIEGFIGKIRTLNMPEEDRQNIITGLENGTIQISFYKDPEGFDDRILLTKLGTIEPYTPKPHIKEIRNERSGGSGGNKPGSGRGRNGKNGASGSSGSGGNSSSGDHGGGGDGP